MHKRTYIALVLDRSGSMLEVKTQTIDGFNEQAAMIESEAAKGGETKVTLVSFGGGSYLLPGITEHFALAAATAIPRLTAESYTPMGGTPMYDAVGYVLTQLEKESQDGDVGFLVIVISDGMENASQTWKGQALADKVKTLQASGKWTFVYIGANQDLADISKHLGIVGGNTLLWTPTVDGYINMSGTLTSSVRTYFNGRSNGVTSYNDLVSQPTHTDSTPK